MTSSTIPDEDAEKLLMVKTLVNYIEEKLTDQVDMFQDMMYQDKENPPPGHGAPGQLQSFVATEPLFMTLCPSLRPSLRPPVCNHLAFCELLGVLVATVMSSVRLV